MDKYYSINEVFISKLGFYNETLNEFYPIDYESFELIVPTKDGKYRKFKNKETYKCFRDATSKFEMMDNLYWGNLIPLYSYLTSEEIENGVVSKKRLYEIYLFVNSSEYLSFDKPNDNVYTFVPR